MQPLDHIPAKNGIRLKRRGAEGAERRGEEAGAVRQNTNSDLTAVLCAPLRSLRLCVKSRPCFALLTLAAGLLAAGISPAAAAVKVGDAFPDLATFQLEGKLPADCAGKIVIVDFWASWCKPCKQSFPALNELQAKYAAQGVVIIAINVDENRADMDDFLKKIPATFPIVRDASQKLVGQTGINTMPSSFVIDRTGKVRFAHSGFHGDDTKKTYIAEIESLLAQ